MSICLTNISSLVVETMIVSFIRNKSYGQELNRKFKNKRNIQQYIEVKYWQNIWVEMTSEVFQSMKLEFRRKVNVSIKY